MLVCLSTYLQWQPNSLCIKITSRYAATEMSAVNQILVNDERNGKKSLHHCANSINCVLLSRQLARCYVSSLFSEPTS